MLSPSLEILQLLSEFAIVFTAHTFGKALIYGKISGTGRRIVTQRPAGDGTGREFKPTGPITGY